jgi:hypothetical protein
MVRPQSVTSSDDVTALYRLKHPTLRLLATPSHTYMCLTLPLTVVVEERWKPATNGATVPMQLDATQSLQKALQLIQTAQTPTSLIYGTFRKLPRSTPSECTTGRPNSSAGRMIHHRNP